MPPICVSNILSTKKLRIKIVMKKPMAIPAVITVNAPINPRSVRPSLARASSLAPAEKNPNSKNKATKPMSARVKDRTPNCFGPKALVRIGTVATPNTITKSCDV